jgi:hypothetical protein
MKTHDYWWLMKRNFLFLWGLLLLPVIDPGPSCHLTVCFLWAGTSAGTATPCRAVSVMEALPMALCRATRETHASAERGSAVCLVVLNRILLGPGVNKLRLAEARVRSRVSPCGIYGERSSTLAVFLRVIRFSALNIISSGFHVHESWTLGPLEAAVQRQPHRIDMNMNK